MMPTIPLTDNSRWPNAQLAAAEYLTSQYFGLDRKLFAPIYVRNHCVNDCSYCGYRRGNRSLRRQKLTPSQARAEAEELVRRGVSDVLILAGELPEAQYLDHFCECVATIRSTPGIRWAGVEVAPLSERGCGRLLDAGADSFIVFQESYDRAVYANVHPVNDPKGDFDLRRECLDVAVSAGFREVGLGVLYGLADPRAETDKLIEHAQSLCDAEPGLHVRLSFPRFRPAPGARMDVANHPVDEYVLAECIASSRVALPKADLVLTARESLDFRLAVMKMVTAFGAGGSTSVGGYSTFPDEEASSQFVLLDRSPAADFVDYATRAGYRIH